MELVAIDGNPIPPGAVVASVRTADGVTLRAARWPGQKGRRGTVFLVQGRNEFIEKYFETVGELLARGFAVATFDWRGQGGSDRLLSSGRCHIETYADYDCDLDAVMREIVLPDCPPPHFALAHSMGALACLRAARDRRVRFERMVLLTPMLSLSRIVSPPMGVVGLLTGLGLLLGLDEAAISRRPWRRWKKLDPEEDSRQIRTAAIVARAPALASGTPTIRWLYAACRAMKEGRSPPLAASVAIPALLVAAGRDNVVGNEAIVRLAAALRMGGQVLVPGARHEVLMEPDALRQLFWAAFDAFIPGSPDESL